MVHHPPHGRLSGGRAASGGDTIAAPATPPGRGALAVVRVSGPRAPELARSLAGDPLPEPRRAALRALRDGRGRVLDQAVLTRYAAPASATGEDLLEISCHGAPAVVAAVLARLRELGARMAEPGEFSRRAFEAGKLDLAQAQAVADLAAATTERAARCAARVLTGGISREIHAISQEIVEIMAYVEGALDFPDEDVDWLAEQDFGPRLRALEERLEALLARARQGRAVGAGARLALLGPPNAGKSSLLNHFTGADTAIVTAEPGTTRDVLTAPLQLDGVPLHLQDTAGIRDPDAAAEAEGVRRSWRAAEQADLVLQVYDAAAGWGPANAALAARLGGRPRLTLANKIDLLPAGVPAGGPDGALPLSAKTGAGVPELRARILAELRLDAALEEGEFMAHGRQLEALERARGALDRARAADGGELLAEELRAARRALGALVGEFAADDLLDEIFGRFCIGK